MGRALAAERHTLIRATMRTRSTDAASAERGRRLTTVVVSALAVAALLALGVSPSAFAAATMGTGAVSVKGQSSELVPGATIEIRQNDCAGPPVWRTTTGSTNSAFGAFGISLDAGDYCIATLAVPAGYGAAADALIRMEARAANWFTVWLPGSPIVTGAVVAKDAFSNGVNGVTAVTTEGPCTALGRPVWQNTTATSRWSTGGYGVSLAPGTYCTTVIAVPLDYSAPDPVETVVSAPGPVWITLWMTLLTTWGTADARILIDSASTQYAVRFECNCTGPVSLQAFAPGGGAGDRLDTLVDRTGTTSGVYLLGFAHAAPRVYTDLLVKATGNWTLRLVYPDSSIALVGGTSASGVGDTLVLLTGAAPNGAATFTNGSTGQLLVTGPSPASDTATYVDVTGAHSTRIALQTPTVFAVSADGAWSVALD